MTLKSTHQNALIGAYIADAATLGVHWLYDPERIEALGKALWRTPDAADFAGAKGVFVHHGKRSGDISQYGAQLRVMVQSLGATGGRFDVTDYQTHFAAAFGPGGWWHGYIDKATKGTLANIVTETSPSGAYDDHIPALSALPALIAAGVSDETCAAAVATVSNHEASTAYAPAAWTALRAVMGGAAKADALQQGIGAADTAVRGSLVAAFEGAGRDPVAFAGEVGRACPLPQSMPVAFQIAATAGNYVEAIEMNARAGGDNCGRAIFLGAFFGAQDPAPVLWAARLCEGPELAAEITAL